MTPFNFLTTNAQAIFRLLPQFTAAHRESLVIFPTSLTGGTVIRYTYGKHGYKCRV